MKLNQTELRQVCCALTEWYSKHKRDLPWRRDPTPWHVWVSEVMLQQTQVETVIPYFEKFMQRFPTVQSFAEAEEAEVLKYWSGLGYYRRVRMLHAAAKEVISEHNGVLPSRREAMLALPGVGEYTAGAVISIAFNEPEAILDGNVIRILTRLFGIDDPVKAASTKKKLWQLAKELVLTADRQEIAPREFNQAMMELGALVCRPSSPSCLLCPVREYCYALNHHAIAKLPQLPKRSEKKGQRYFAAWVEDASGNLLVVQRKGGSLLPDGLWELPHIPWPEDEVHIPSERLQKMYGIALQESDAELKSVKHGIMNYAVEVQSKRYSTEQSHVAPKTASRGRESDSRKPSFQRPMSIEAMQWVKPDALTELAYASITKKIIQKFRPAAQASG